MGDGAAVSQARLEPNAVPAQRGTEDERPRGLGAGNLHPLLSSPLQWRVHPESKGMAVPGWATPGDRPREESKASAPGRCGMEERGGGFCVLPQAGRGRAIATVLQTALAHAESLGERMPASAGRGYDIPRSRGGNGRIDFDCRELRRSGGQEVSAGGSQIR